MQPEQMTAPRPQEKSLTRDGAGRGGAVGLRGGTSALGGAVNGRGVAEATYSFDTTPGKLPKTVIPLHYAIELTPDLGTLALGGVETVDIEVRVPTARLTLNAVNMMFGAASIDDDAQRAGDAQRADIALDAAAETATLSFPQPLAAGQHRLRIAFMARINKFRSGLFYVDYPTDTVTKRII